MCGAHNATGRGLKAMNDNTDIGTPRIAVISCDLAASARRCAQLTLAGWDTIRVIDLVDCLHIVSREDADLVLLQFSTDRTTETGFSNILREVSSDSRLPVVVEIDDPAQVHGHRLLKCGADDIIYSCTSAPEMIARIRALLRVRILHDQLNAPNDVLNTVLQRERRLLRESQRGDGGSQVMAKTDPLTQVDNAGSSRSLLATEFRIAKRYNQSLSLLMLEVDHFKQLNDTHGHPNGDYVLKDLADILGRMLRDSDAVARTGNAEFAIILPRTDRTGAAHLAEQICSEVAAHTFNAYGKEIRATVSIGTATYPADFEITEPELLWYFADQALLVARDSGRNRVEPVHRLDETVRVRLRNLYLSYRCSPAPVRPAPVGPQSEVDCIA